MKLKKIIPLLVAVVVIGVSLFNKNCNSSNSDSQTQSTTANSQNQISEDLHVALGIPVKANNDDCITIRREQYVVGYNTEKNNPDWVSWNLSDYWYGDEPRHKGQFMPDTELPRGVYRVTHRDYTGSGFDRGHMVRSEERTRNREDNQSTFFTTNLLPQYHELNAGPWLRLEELCEFLCKRRKKELYVIAGPIYKEDMGLIGNGVVVPSHCFKIIVMLEKGQGLSSINENTKVISVIMPNSREIERDNWRDYETTVSEIEKQTGYDFLNKVPKEIQNKIESRKSKEEVS